MSVESRVGTYSAAFVFQIEQTGFKMFTTVNFNRLRTV